METTSFSKKLLFFFIFSFILFLVSCSSPTKSKTGTLITISDVWFSDFVDNDNDGYYSNVFMYFDLAVNKASASVIVKLGIREADPMDASEFTLCFESQPLEIIGSADDNIWYVPLSAISYAITQGTYDFLLQVFPASNPSSAVAEKKPSTDQDMSGIKLEPPANDMIEEWISYIDDDICESSFTYYPRRPVGAGYHSLAERFAIPAGVPELLVKQVAVYVSAIYQNPTQFQVSVYDNSGNLPDEAVYTADLSNITLTGWKTLDLNYTVDWPGAFYVGVPPSIDYGIGVDDNSSVHNGVRHYYASTYPPQDYWEESGSNYGIRALVRFYPGDGAGATEKATARMLPVPTTEGR